MERTNLYKKTEVGVIPEDWEVRKVKDLGEIITGGTPSTKVREFWDGVIPWVNPTDISDRKDIYHAEREITNLGLSTLRKLLLILFWSHALQVLVVLSSRSRLHQIVKDIILDMETKDRLQNGRGNAILIAGSIYEACKYYELFQAEGLRRCAIVTSYNPNISDIKGEATGEDKATENVEKYRVYQNMLDGKPLEAFEEEVKRKFVEEPAQMKLLIVVDKLLTGFDAPPATYLYIDKSMKDQGPYNILDTFAGKIFSARKS